MKTTKQHETVAYSGDTTEVLRDVLRDNGLNPDLVIAAAELLSACEIVANHHCVGSYRGDYTMRISADEMAIIRTAIAEAKGNS